MAMLLSTLVVFNQLNLVDKASAQPGVSDWGDATSKLVYGVSYARNTIKINTSGWGAARYYLYYPTYECLTTGGRPANDFDWTAIFLNDEGDQVYVEATGGEDALNTNNRAITFNRSGMWIFDDTDAVHDDFVGYLWVNTSTAYTISTISDFTFGATDDVAIEVKEEGILVNCRIAVIAPDGTTILNSATGADVVEIDSDEFTMAGEYTVRAYKDLDEIQAAYYYLDEDGDAPYGPSYGSGSYFTGIYNYSTVGPWDPPEKNATQKTFTVKTAKPNMVVKDDSGDTILYWGYGAEISINITRPDGTGIEADEESNLSLRAPNGTFYKEDDFPNLSIDFSNDSLGNYTITLPQWQSGVNDNDWDLITAGYWYVVFGYDIDGDGNEEWNSSYGAMNRLTLKTTTPPVQLRILDDGSGDPTDKKVDIPAFDNGTGEGIFPIEVEFSVTGSSITDVDGRLYYGDDKEAPYNETWENFEVTGDILWPVDNYSFVYDSMGTWSVYVLPAKPGGSFTISIDWPGDDNGTSSQTIDIVNGSFVTTNIDSFAIGENVTLTVTVKDMDQESLKYATVWLVWEDLESDERDSMDYAFNHTVGNNGIGTGRNGEYTFLIDTEQQGEKAPRYLAVAVYDSSSQLAGYEMIDMTRRHNMQVNMTPVTAYAGDAVEYDITVTLLEGGSPDEDTHGGLHVMIYNETGEKVTDTAISSLVDPITNDASITDFEIILAAGTYYFYAYNDTHDSQGYNATLTVTSYTVSASPSVLAWLIDEETNLTFQITPAVTGTLKLLNMTGTNGTWVGREAFVDVEDGVGTLEEISATDLGNITYEFMPFGGEYRPAEGLLRVTTATATPNPAAIYLNEPTTVTITVTHPATGAPLEDVRVGLDYGLLLNQSILAKLPSDVQTDAAGRAVFSIMADASGEVTIFIENETDPDNEFVITAQARKPMNIVVDPSSNEKGTFTVKAYSNNVLITDTTVTFTFDGQTWPTTTGEATLTAPTVTASLTYPITATAEGYTTGAAAVIMILNVPKLIVVVSGEVKAGQTFTATIADDTGKPIVGATLSFEGKTYTTDATGSATITAPSTEGSYPVTATFPGYESVSDTVIVTKGGGIPGFELLTLIAAIGVAFLLLRRRRN